MATDLNPILDKLISKSEQQKIAWKPTYSPDIFIAALEGEFTFRIGRFSSDDYSFLMKDKADNTIVDIISRRTTTKFDPNLHPDDSYFNKLMQLHDLARDAALDVSKKLDDLQALLDRF